MYFILKCRRTFLGICAIGCLTAIGLCKNIDVSIAIAGVVASVSAANSAQKIGEKRYDKNIND